MILSFIGLWMGHISDAPSSERESEPVALERPACKHVKPGHISSGMNEHQLVHSSLRTTDIQKVIQSNEIH